MNKKNSPEPVRDSCTLGELDKHSHEMGYVGISFSMDDEAQMDVCKRTVSELAVDQSHHYAFSKDGTMSVFMHKETAERLGIPAKKMSLKGHPAKVFLVALTKNIRSAFEACFNLRRY